MTLCSLLEMAYETTSITHMQTKRSGIINEDGKNKISGTSANPAIHTANKIFSQKYMKSVHLLTLM